MSQYPPDPYPPQFPPLPYMTPGVYRPNPRPTTVTVIAIFAIVFGSIGVWEGFAPSPSTWGLSWVPI